MFFNKNKLAKVMDLLFQKVTIVIYIVISSFVLVINFGYTTFIGSFPKENPMIFKSHAWKYLATILVLVSILFLISKYIAKVNPNYLFWGLLCLFLICGLILALNASQILRNADSKSCIELARQLNKHDFTELSKSKYIGWYPFQIYWISFLRLFAITKYSVQSFYIFNLIVNSATITLIFLITKYIGLSVPIRNITTIMSFLFTPLLFRTLFVYNNNFAQLILISGLILLVLAYQKNNSFICFVSAGLFVLAALLKNNFLIGLVAIVFVLVFATKNRKMKGIFIVFSLFLMLMVPIITNKYYSSFTNNRFPFNDAGIPKMSYLVMGSAEAVERNGWYNGYTLDTYRKNHYSSKKTQEQSKRDLIARCSYFKRHPMYTAKFFYSKTITTWTDPTFQTLWDAPIPIVVNTKNPQKRIINRIYSVYSNNSVKHNNPQNADYRYISQLNKLIVLITLLSSIFVGLLLLIKDTMFNETYRNYCLFAFLFFIGGFIFHFFWETKSQYVLQYIILLIPIGFDGFQRISFVLLNKRFKNRFLIKHY